MLNVATNYNNFIWSDDVDDDYDSVYVWMLELAWKALLPKK